MPKYNDNTNKRMNSGDDKSHDFSNDKFEPKTFSKPEHTPPSNNNNKSSEE